jgi:hypothetical protein
MSRWDRKSLGLPFVLFLVHWVVLSGCVSISRGPSLGGIYNQLAQHEDPYRNPVILIPGILGSRLVEKGSGVLVWGAFGSGNADFI